MAHGAKNRGGAGQSRERDLSIDEFHTLLDGRCDPKHDVAAWTAPAAGLFLERVVYPD